MSTPTDPASLLTALGLPAAEGSIYEVALTHRSFAFEQSEPVPHNERLEFLGDAVLDLVVTDLIFRTRPDMAEGDLAKLRASVVQGRALAALAREIGLGAHLRLGRGEEASGGRDKTSLLGDAFEALLGAVYMDRGLEYLNEVLVPVFSTLVDDSIARGSGFDAKSALQELVVRETGFGPIYRDAHSGPDHAKNWVVHVYVTEELYGVGTGTSKTAAQQVAAREALDRLEQETTEPSSTDVQEVGSDARAS